MPLFNTPLHFFTDRENGIQQREEFLPSPGKGEVKSLFFYVFFFFFLFDEVNLSTTD